MLKSYRISECVGPLTTIEASAAKARDGMHVPLPNVKPHISIEDAEMAHVLDIPRKPRSPAGLL